MSPPVPVVSKNYTIVNKINKFVSVLLVRHSWYIVLGLYRVVNYYYVYFLGIHMNDISNRKDTGVNIKDPVSFYFIGYSNKS